jgi:hypothetical protein
MLRKTLLLASVVILTALAVSSKAQAWGAYRHFGYTHYSPYTGLHHYGYTRAYGGYDRYGYGGARYGGYGAYGRYYGGYPYGYGYGAYGAARYGYYRAW